jgi:phosphatidylserine decarboxylase
MSDEGRRVLRPGHRIALGPDVYTVIQISGTAVTLQDERGELSAMMLAYLLTAPGFRALDAVPPRRVPQDGRLSTLEAVEQERVRWLEGHLIELESGRHPERPPRAEYDPVLHGTEEREQAKLAEFEAAGRPMTRRHLQRLRRAYREEGLIGLADRRKLRTVTPGGRPTRGWSP